MKKLLTLAFLLSTFTAFSQAVTYYPWNSQLGVSSNPQRSFWMDTRLQMNTYFSSLTAELCPMFNLNSKDVARFYVGAGTRLNFMYFLNDDQKKIVEGFSLHTGVRSAPIAKFPKLQFVFEVSPFVQKSGQIGQIRASLGVGYILNR